MERSWRLHAQKKSVATDAPVVCGRGAALLTSVQGSELWSAARLQRSEQVQNIDLSSIRFANRFLDCMANKATLSCAALAGRWVATAPTVPLLRMGVAVSFVALVYVRQTEPEFADSACSERALCVGGSLRSPRWLSWPKLLYGR